MRTPTLASLAFVAMTGTAFTYCAIVDLGTLGGPVGFANDINARGDVVGLSVTESGEGRAVLRAH